MEYKDDLHCKFDVLKKIINSMESAVVAYSAGVDSTFLLKVAHDVLGDTCVAVTGGSSSVPEADLREAHKFVNKLGVEYIILKYEESGESEDYANNPTDRCFHCKFMLFSKLLDLAANRNLKYVIEGSNVTDKSDYRPGMRAIEKLKIRSPLQEAGLTKDDIRKLSKELDLPTWNKPAMACLASRIPYGNRITIDKLKMVDQAEDYIRGLGYDQVRVRHFGEKARIEVEPDNVSSLHDHLENIRNRFKEIGFEFVEVDPKGYRTGSLNEGIVTENKEGGQ